jgi:hypothetical protein
MKRIPVIAFALIVLTAPAAVASVVGIAAICRNYRVRVSCTRTTGPRGVITDRCEAEAFPPPMDTPKSPGGMNPKKTTRGMPLPNRKSQKALKQNCACATDAATSTRPAASRDFTPRDDLEMNL